MIFVSAHSTFFNRQYFLPLPFMQNKLTVSVLFLFLLIVSARAQDRQPVAHFSGMQTGKIIQLSFVISAGSKCDGVKILRSTNEHDFSLIGQLNGVCGNNSTDETYSFIDISPIKNADNFYELDLTGLGTSDIIKIHFTDFGDKGFLFLPTPVKDKSILYFQNDCNEEFDFVMLDKRGKKAKVINNIRSNSVEITKGTLKDGTYTFQLLIDGKVKYTGSVVIL